MADPKKPTPKPNIYGIDRSNTTTDIRQLFKGLIDFSGKPTGGYNLPAPYTSRTFAFGGAPAPVPFQQSTLMKNIQANMTPAKPTVTPSQPGAGARGQIGAEKQFVAQQKAQLDAMSNIPNPPGGIPTTRPVTTQPFTADMLYQDAAPAYKPLMDLYKDQQQAANERYGVNEADIKNIFGNLTTVRAADKVKIADQFRTSIEQQQNALAARTAETRAGVAAGQQGAATAAAEMGTAGQPAPTDSLTAQAAEQGVADANAYQTTWSALQNVMSQQAQNDVQSAVQGYDYQKASALEQLRANLEDRLAGIEANMAGTESQIAQTNFGSRQNVLNTKYGEAQDAKEQASRLAAAQASAAADANKPKSYPKTVTGWQQKVNDLGFIPNDITNSIQYAKTLAGRAINANLQPGKSRKSPTKAQIWDYWMRENNGADETAVALEYLNLLPK